MAITFVNVGTLVRDAGSGGNITPGLPASIQANDILVLVVGAADNVVVTLPGAYTKKVELNSSTNCRLTVAWARATGSDSAPLVTHTAGNSIFGVIGAYRGCTTVGDPFSAAQSQANAAVTTVNTAPTITPANNEMVIFAAACGEGGTNNGSAQSLSGWSGANPTFTERADNNDPGNNSLLCNGGFADGLSNGSATGSRTVAFGITPQATANGVGALLSLIVASGVASAAVGDPQLFHELAGPGGGTYGPYAFFEDTTVAGPAGPLTVLQDVTATAVAVTASMVKQVNKAVTGTAVAVTGTLVKQVNKAVTATSVVVTGTLAALKVRQQAMTATTVAVTASMVKQVNKNVTATSSVVTASIVKQVNKTLTATAVAVTGTLAAIRVFLKSMTATAVAVTATFQLRTNKNLTATAVVVTASVVKQVNKLVRATNVVVTASMTAIRVFLKAMTATSVVVTASMSRRVNSTLSATVAATASMVKSITHRLTATVNATASLVASFSGPIVGPFKALISILENRGADVAAADTVNAAVSVQDATGATVTATDSGAASATVGDVTGADVSVTDINA